MMLDGVVPAGEYDPRLPFWFFFPRVETEASGDLIASSSKELRPREMLPLPKVPKVRSAKEPEQRERRASGTTTIRGDVLSSLLSGKPVAKEASSSPLLMHPERPRTTTEPPPQKTEENVLEERSVFPSLTALQSVGVARRPTKQSFEIVARFPGAVEVCVESMKQGEAPVLVINRVHDAAAVGGAGDDGDCSVNGMALLGVSRTPHAAVMPAKPVSLHSALSVLGPRGKPDIYPLYLHLADKEAPQKVTDVVLTKVIVATNRRPVVEAGSARFASTLDSELHAKNICADHDADDSGLYWGFATIAVPSAAEEKIERRRVDDINDVTFVGWVPASRDQCLEAVSAAGTDCFVYVHGFNTNLQFAARTAQYYAVKFKKPVAACFAWPSNPPLPKTWAISAVLSVAERNYTAAEQMMQRSVASLVAVATHLKRASKGRLLWKAHSMGCYLVLNAMDRVLQRIEGGEINDFDDDDATVGGVRDGRPPPIVFESVKKKTKPVRPKVVVAAMFTRVILDAPDAPTWFFVDTVTRAARHDVRFLHLFHTQDEAVEIARQRRGLDFPAPGNGHVVPDVLGIQVVDCTSAKASMGNHDYGRKDTACLDDQRGFLDAVQPEDRALVNTEKLGLWVLPTSSGGTPPVPPSSSDGSTTGLVDV